MADNIYPLGLKTLIADGFADDGGAAKVWKLALMSSDGTPYTYSESHEFWDDGPEAAECGLTSDGYTAGGETVVPVIQHDAANDRIEIVVNATNVTWSSLGHATSPNETITSAVLYHSTGTPATSTLLGFFDLNDTLTTDQDFTLTLDQTNGNLQIPYTIG